VRKEVLVRDIDGAALKPVLESGSGHAIEPTYQRS
jgi:hypothetical protein